MKPLIALATLLFAIAGGCDGHSSPVAPAHTLHLAALPSVSLPPWGPAPIEVDVLIQAKVAAEYARYCVGVWIKNVQVAPVADSTDQYWFIGDYYQLDPDQTRPTHYAVKGVCTMHSRQMRIYDLREAVGGCYTAPVATIPAG